MRSSLPSQRSSGSPASRRSLSGGWADEPTRFKVRSGRGFTYGDFLAGDFKWLQQESTFWRRSLWERAGGGLDPRLRLAVDFELWMRFFRHTRLYTAEALLGAFRRRDGQRSAVLLDDHLAEAESVIRRERDEIQSGTIIVPEGAARRSGWGASRIVRRLRKPRRDISRAQVEAARLARRAERIKAPVGSER